MPTAGTAAHAFTLLHDTEPHAFRAQLDSLGKSAPRCWSTRTTCPRVRTAIEVAGPRSARSGSTPATCRAGPAGPRAARRAGATKTRIVLTGDLDEFAIAGAVRRIRSDGYGVGTSLVTGSGAPTPAMVYKLVARASASEAGVMEPVAERRPGQAGPRRAQVGGPAPGPAGHGAVRAGQPVAAGAGAARPRAARAAGGGRRGGESPGGRGGAGTAPRVAGRTPALRAATIPGYPAIPTVFDPNGDEVLQRPALVRKRGA